MNKTLRNERGQYIPISAMMMFTIVVFMVAVVNVYKVSRAKLIAQNLADASALHLASQQATILNHMADRNEWLNHMVQGTPAADGATVAVANINQAEHVWFDSVKNAAVFGLLVQTVNAAQDAFNTAFSGDMGAHSGRGQSGVNDSLKGNLAEIKGLSDGTVQYYTWNNKSGDPIRNNTNPFENVPHDQQPVQNIQPLEFVTHDLQINYAQDVRYPWGQTVPKAANGKANLSDIVNKYVQNPPPGVTLTEHTHNSGSGIGWMELKPDSNQQITTPGSSSPSHVGSGAIIKKTVNLGPVIGDVVVTAKSVAYVANQTGNLPGVGPTATPVDSNTHFKPTYWVKLVPAQ